MLGKTISHYKILEKIGEGGMGIIYKALDTKLNRTVALKFLAPHLLTSSEEKVRFYQEAQAAANLDHSNICTIYEIDEVENQTFIAMAYLEGESLKEKLESGTPTLEEAAGLALQISEGLKAAHQQGIVHRDIKSSNILLTKNNQAKILDFGLAKWSGSTLVTKPGTTRGTVAYMSPEQVQGANVDQRTDIWSWGVVLYEMLTGQLPFRSEYDQAVLYSILNEEPLPISTLRTEVPQEWEKIINKCLQKNPAQRYQNVTALQIDLKKAMHQMGLRELAVQFITAVKKPIFASALSKISLGAAGLLLILLLLWLFPTTQRTLKSWLGIKPSAFEKHLVVLPFTNMGGDPTKQAFCDGLTETINNGLTQLEKFQGTPRVVPASDVQKSKVTSAEEAHKIFGVNLAVSGSIQSRGDSLRLTLNLIDTKSLRQLKSTVGEYQKINFAQVQEKAVSKLAQILGIEMKPEIRRELTRGNTSLSKAYIAYLNGRGHLQRSGKLENIDLAIDFLETALKEDSLYSLAYAALGEAYWSRYVATRESHWIQPAEKNCIRAIQLEDHLTTAYVTLGIILKGSGRYQEAVDEFQKALKLDSLNSGAYKGLADAYESLGKIDQAESTYHKAIGLRPNLWTTYNNLGVFYYRRGRFEDALVEFQRVVQLNPHNHSIYNNMGGICMLLKRWPDARECFERSLEIQPNYVAYNGLGNLYFYQESRYVEAAQMYQKALELDSLDYRNWGSLAPAYYWAGERSKAYNIYQQAIQMAEKRRKANPQDAELLSHLADFYSMLGEKEKSLTMLEQSLALAPSDVEVMARAAETYEQLGLREKALEWVEKALRNGYSLTMVERSPGLKQLRADIRFQHLTQKLADQSQK